MSEAADTSVKRRLEPDIALEVSESKKAARTEDTETATAASSNHSASPSEEKEESSDPAKAAAERLAKFKALRARAKTSLDANRKEVYAEHKRKALDPNISAKLERKSEVAEFKLAKLEAEEAGEDFERKRAWDWTVEEAERWDRKQEKKQKHREDVAFQDYTQHARKVYKKQMRELKPDLSEYQAAKEKIISNGEIVETEDGELVAIDRDGNFFASADSLAFVNNKPDKKGVDRLVADLRKAEENRNKRRRGGEDDDVTYINDKNKNFNKKLSRYYDKYTQEIRDSFERGTMI